MSPDLALGHWVSGSWADPIGEHFIIELTRPADEPVSAMTDEVKDYVADQMGALPHLLEVAHQVVALSEDTFWDPDEMTPEFVALYHLAKLAIAKHEGRRT